MSNDARSSVPLRGPARAGALIYTLDLQRLAGFYEAVFGMQRRVADADRIVLASPDLQLLLHAVPEPYRASVVAGTPARPREQVPVRLFLSVPSFAAAAVAMREYGGELFPDVWQGPGFMVRNGCDCEGNVLQLREWQA